MDAVSENYREDGRCPGCGGTLVAGLSLCSPCKARDRERAEAAKAASDGRSRRQAAAIQATEAAFPEVIRETVLDRLDERLAKIVHEYDPQARESWLLFGSTRVGKTRTAYLLAKKHTATNGTPAHFYTMRRLESVIDRSFREKKHAEVLDNLIEAPFLVIDDFGKEKLTERLAVDLFALLDERTANRRPTIITTNLNGDLLEAKFAAVDANLAAALVARLREFFRRVAAF